MIHLNVTFHWWILAVIPVVLIIYKFLPHIRIKLFVTLGTKLVDMLKTPGTDSFNTEKVHMLAIAAVSNLALWPTWIYLSIKNNQMTPIDTGIACLYLASNGIAGAVHIFGKKKNGDTSDTETNTPDLPTPPPTN